MGDNNSVWYSIKKASELQKSIKATAVFLICDSLFFVSSDAIFEPLETEVVGDAIKHTCILFYVVHLCDLCRRVTEQVSYLLYR